MTFLLLIAFAAFAFRRLRTYLHIYQQEEYQPIRFIRWLWRTRSLDRKLTLVIVILGAADLFFHLNYELAVACLSAVFALFALIEKDPRNAAKKKLIMTARATRIFWCALLLSALVAFLYTLPGVPALAWIVPVQAIPFALPLANLILTPYEKSVQKRFWREAHAKLLALQPTVVGITGSYGKTSTKHILGHILGVQASTLITPGSVNTPMGIARIVREQLGPHHRFFVCEMGAYGPGSIARLCKLAPPKVGAITAIGMAHYERFKSLEAVAQTKFELAEAVAQAKGTAIVHEQAMNFPASQAFARDHAETLQVVGEAEGAAVHILRAAQERDGIAADVEWQGRTFALRAPLFGEHHIGNMAVAFGTACALGVNPDDAVLALATTPQISHRLQVGEGYAQSRLIDDAYNSNPAGFASALKLLDQLRVDGGRRILVTPGMVELGTAHDTEHRVIGKLAGQYADILLPVLPERIAELTIGFRETNPEGVVVPCPNFHLARRWLEANVQKEDVVLMENDLPDLYEKKLRL